MQGTPPGVAGMTIEFDAKCDAKPVLQTDSTVQCSEFLRKVSDFI